MAGTLIDYIEKHKMVFGPATAGGDPIVVLFGKAVLKNGTDNRAFDISADIPNLKAMIMPSGGGYVFDYDLAAKTFAIYRQTASTGALAAVTGVDLGAITIHFFAIGT